MVVRVHLPVKMNVGIDPARHDRQAGKIVVGLAAAGTDRHDPAAFKYDALILENRTLAVEKSSGLEHGAILRKGGEGEQSKNGQRILRIVKRRRSVQALPEFLRTRFLIYLQKWQTR